MPFLGVFPYILIQILSFSVFISQYRLDKENIFARNPRLILPFGNVDCVAFDKTGTLTGHTYSLAFLQAVTDGKFAEYVVNFFSHSPLILICLRFEYAFLSHRTDLNEIRSFMLFFFLFEEGEERFW